MFYSFETAREDQEAADEAARNEAALYEANNAFDYENETADMEDAHFAMAAAEMEDMNRIDDWAPEEDVI